MSPAAWDRVIWLCLLTSASLSILYWAGVVEWHWWMAIPAMIPLVIFGGLLSAFLLYNYREYRRTKKDL